LEKEASAFKRGLMVFRCNLYCSPQCAIQTEHPDWNADQVNREIAKRISLGVVNDAPKALPL
jgi:hypothetical protein